MRSHSTPQSALNLEITKLAIIECIFATAVYVGIGMYVGTFKHLAWAVVVAPLMLFRTEASAEWGLKLFAHALDKSDKKVLESPLSFIIVVFIVPPLAGN